MQRCSCNMPSSLGEYCYYYYYYYYYYHYYYYYYFCVTFFWWPVLDVIYCLMSAINFKINYYE